MPLLLRLCTLVDRVNRGFAILAALCVLAACFVSAGNAGLRYAASLGSNAWLELQWYLFAYMVMLGGPYVLKVNEHVRVDLLYGSLSVRKRIWVDIVGIALFLMPATVYLLLLSWPPALDAWQTGEISPNAGGLVRWPARFALPVGFALMLLQGAAEFAKRVAMLSGHLDAEIHYERPLQ